LLLNRRTEPRNHGIDYLLTEIAVRFDDRRDVGFFLFVASWIVVVFANGSVVMKSMMIIPSRTSSLRGDWRSQNSHEDVTRVSLKQDS
jgi:hypothetical protein